MVTLSVNQGLPTMVVRADAGAAIGTGHLMRSLALAQAWLRRAGEVIFVGFCVSERIRERIRREGMEFVSLVASHPDENDSATTLEVLSRNPSAFLVLDGYNFDRRYHELVKSAGRTLIVIDDLAHLDHYVADVVLNQGLARDVRYSCEPHTVRLLGPRYALLRQEFLRWRGWTRTLPDVARRILITFGGSDPHNQTGKVLQGLRQTRVTDLEVLVVVGPANPYEATLRQLAAEDGLPVSFMADVEDMGDVMAWADLAITGAGSTCWELAFMGLPMVLITLAENQRPVAAAVEQQGAGLSLGWWDSVTEREVAAAVGRLVQDPARRRQMSSRGREVVDGSGADRVVDLLREVVT